MKLKISQKDLVESMLFLFLFVCIFLPGDIYHLKILFFAAVCVLGCNAFFAKSIRDYAYIIIMGLIYPMLLMVWSTLLTGDIGSAVSGAYSLILIILVLVVRYYKIDYEKMLMKLLFGLAILTVGVVLLDVVGLFDVNGSNLFRNMVYEQYMGVMGKSPAYALYYKVFFNASPLLNIALPYWFLKKKYVKCSITFFALMFSGTRANILVSCTILCFGLFIGLKENKTNSKLRVLIEGIFTFVAMFMIPMVIRKISSMMFTSGSVISDTLRMNQLYSFMDHFSNPINMLLGTGFGSEFFDAGRGTYVTEAEIAYLDLLRKIGLLFFIPFILFLLKPLKWKIEKYYKLAYIGYLLICFTNPLLISSTASVLYIYMYTKHERHKITQMDNTRYISNVTCERQVEEKSCNE